MRLHVLQIKKPILVWSGIKIAARPCQTGIHYWHLRHLWHDCRERANVSQKFNQIMTAKDHDTDRLCCEQSQGTRLLRLAWLSTANHAAVIMQQIKSRVMSSSAPAEQQNRLTSVTWKHLSKGGVGRSHPAAGWRLQLPGEPVRLSQGAHCVPKGRPLRGDSNGLGWPRGAHRACPRACT